MICKVLALVTGLAATASAFDCHGNYFSFYNRDGNALSYQRLDPALNPGAESAHLHSFDGGNGLTAFSSYGDVVDSTCSTARIKTDKSLYWRPTLFFNGNGTGFYRVPEKSTKIYYKFGDGDKWANVTGFPKDFSMIAGSSLKRSDGANPAGIRWACHQPDGGNMGDVYSNGFPNGFTSCGYGFATEVTFPSCWNGQKIDPKNPNAHMAYPNGNGGVGVENCPTTHRAARFPTIFIEFWYDVSSFNGQYGANDSPWVLSNGDPTGYGFHADFLNGWEEGVLEKAIAETGGCNCGCGCGQQEMEQCFGAANVNKDNDAEFKSCAVKEAVYSGDDRALLPKLPGCNPIQPGPQDATAARCDTPSTLANGSKTSAAANSFSTNYSQPIKATSDVPKVSKQDYASNTSLSPSASDKPYGNASASSPGGAKATSSPTKSSSQSAASSRQSTASPQGCQTPVYVTVTSSVYVTMAKEASICASSAATKTVTQIAVITVKV